MANINLSSNTYVDYVASMYFKAMNVVNVNFTPKIVEVGGEQVPIVHIDGVQTSTGIKVNVDLFPRNHASDEDLAAMPKSLDDIEFRIGYWPEIDGETGEQTLRQGTPKWTAYYHGGKVVKLSGEKREFGE